MALSLRLTFLRMLLAVFAAVALSTVGLASPLEPATAPGPSATAQASTWDAILQRAATELGEPGAEAAAFLAANRPDRDIALDPDLVIENITLALQARDRFPWCKSLPEAIFFNDVLPYAVLDETRERWRPRLYEVASTIVSKSTNATDAAQALNRELFKVVNVSYSTARKKPNQSPFESMEQGLASCTGLSILLVDACRSVGIPARVAGIGSWVGTDGNHTWVEVYDGERWRFTGAAEYDAAGLDRGWFTGQASKAIQGHELHAIWASSWKATGDRFPLIWNISDRSVPAVDVTSSYVVENVEGVEHQLHSVRLWASRGGKRLAADLVLEGDKPATSATYEDPVDVNRAATLPVPAKFPCPLRVTIKNSTRTAYITETQRPGKIIDLYWDELAIGKADAKALADELWKSHAESILAERTAELEANLIKLNVDSLRLLHKRFGEAPANGASLWISMHGGGGTTAEVNDKQWQNQLGLYQPAEGVYVAPRAPSDSWNLWHRPEVDALFDRLIESAIVVWGVNPNRIYLMGYSAGGDGVYQLAPRMADRFAAASMMAGHPNDASPLGLRNLPFAIFMGGDDAAYNRNTVAQTWADQLGKLREQDPDGYQHLAKIYPGLGHWMQRKDAESVPWMAAHTRNPWPHNIIWRQGNTPHTRFYWLGVPASQAKPNQEIRARIEGQTITLTSDHVTQVDLLLSDELLDLDQPIKVIANGRTIHEALIAPRTEDAIARSIRQRPDPSAVASAVVNIMLEMKPGP